MATYRTIDLYAATDYAQLCTAASIALAPNELDAKVIRGDRVLLRWRLFGALGTLSAFGVPALAGLEFVVTNRYQCSSTTGILIYSGDAGFDPSLWSDANRSLGYVCCELDTNTTPLAASLGTTAAVTYYAALIMTPAGTSEHIALAQFDFPIQNDVWRVGQAATVPIVLYPPMTESSSSSSSSSTVNLSTSSESTSSSSESSSSSTVGESTSQSSTSGGETSSTQVAKSSSSSSSSTAALDESSSTTANLSTSSASSASTAAFSTSSPSSASTVGLSTSSESSSSSSSTQADPSSESSSSSGGTYPDLLVAGAVFNAAYNGTYTYQGPDGNGNPFWSQAGFLTIQYGGTVWIISGSVDWYSKSAADPPPAGSYLGTYDWRLGGDTCTVTAV